MKKEGGQNAFAFCHTLFYIAVCSYHYLVRIKPRRRTGEYQRFTLMLC